VAETNPTRRDLLRLSAGAGVAVLAGCGELSQETADERTPETFPAVGYLPEELGAFDDLLVEFTTTHDVPGAVCAVAHEGEVVLRRGYGHCDDGRTESTAPETLFRIGSLSKAFTRAAVRSLVASGQLERSRPAFELLPYETLPGEPYNAELDDVTVDHLLHHRGGWDRTRTDDPLFEQLDIALGHGWEEPPTERELIRHMLSEPLQFKPGTETEYSNFGYLVLGHVVEAVAGEPYQEYLESAVLEPHGISDVRLGRSLPTDRSDRETWYFDERLCRNVVEMEPMELVRCPDGGFHLESMSAAGGHVATADALLEFMSQYWLDGHPRDGGEETTLSFNGTLPGTFALALQHRGVDVVVLFNQRGYAPNYSPIERELRELVESVDGWPA